ncbi:hypothetical protein ARSEF1564_010275 [Beauveria bassiana]
MTGEGVVAFVEIVEIVEVVEIVEIVEIVVAIVEIVVAEGAVQGNKESKYSSTLILGIPKSGRQRTRYTLS